MMSYLYAELHITSRAWTQHQTRACSHGLTRSPVAASACSNCALCLALSRNNQPAKGGHVMGDWTAVEGLAAGCNRSVGANGEGGALASQTKRTVNTKGTAERANERGHDGGASSCGSRSRESGVLIETISSHCSIKHRNFSWFLMIFCDCKRVPPACRTRVSGPRCRARTSRILFRERCWNVLKGTCQRAGVCVEEPSRVTLAPNVLLVLLCASRLRGLNACVCVCVLCVTYLM